MWQQAGGPEGWTLVRRVKPGYSWHPATDRLAGTDVYGTKPETDASTSDETFSIAYSDVDFNTMLFATGDQAIWLVCEKTAIGAPFTSDYYGNEQRAVVMSSESPSAYTASWYNRNGVTEDPWLSVTDHFNAISAGKIIYGEASFGSTHASAILPVHNGANVWIKALLSPPPTAPLPLSPPPSCPLAPGSDPTTWVPMNGLYDGGGDFNGYFVVTINGASAPASGTLAIFSDDAAGPCCRGTSTGSAIPDIATFGASAGKTVFMPSVKERCSLARAPIDATMRYEFTTDGGTSYMLERTDGGDDEWPQSPTMQSPIELALACAAPAPTSPPPASPSCPVPASDPTTWQVMNGLYDGGSDFDGYFIVTINGVQPSGTLAIFSDDAEGPCCRGLAQYGQATPDVAAFGASAGKTVWMPSVKERCSLARVPIDATMRYEFTLDGESTSFLLERTDGGDDKWPQSPTMQAPIELGVSCP